MSSDPNAAHRIICVTGPAGAGRQTALRALEDMGFEAIDNLPLRLVASLIDNPGPGIGTALGLDPRSREFSTNHVLALLDAYAQNPNISFELLYLDCNTQTLLNRFSETRRRHPLADRGTIETAIEAEKSLLEPLLSRASLRVDTSDLTIHDLRTTLSEWFSPGGVRTLNVAIHSFSYKRGLPLAADMVFDCRFLRNPYWQTELRPHSGENPAVQAYVVGDPRCAPFEARVNDLIQSLLPAFVEEGKSHVAIAFGCTGGRHRSVTLAERCAAALAEHGWRVSVKHRDIETHKRNEAAA